MTDLILGAGGGGGGGGGKGGDSGGGSQHTPTEAANSLFSTSYAKLIDLISEGEIYGLVNGLKSIYVDNTPLQNPDGSYNFQNVTVYTKTGTQAQTYIPGFDDVANEVSVGTTVTASTPIVRTITNTAINAAKVTISVPQLQQFTDQGDINGTSIQLQIAVQYNGGGFTTVIDDTISGRTGQQYQKQYSINLSGAFPVDIRVTRVTTDSGSSKLINAFNWSSYTEVTYAKLAYPNAALVGIRIDAEQFSNIPGRSYRVRGIKVKIPSNGTVNSTTGAITYTGTWDGTFGAAQWTSDPAWCLWDLLTSTRYGFGNHIDTTQLDKWAFYSASQYCGASVPDGFGGTEPRFSCNVNIQTADDAYKLINDMCSVFRAMPYWSTGALTVAQDKPSDPAYLFTYANVSEEGFSYSGSSLKTRPTVAVVQYMDLSLRNAAFEVVEDQKAISKYGVIKTEITAFACTSRGQAHRIGEWLLYSSQYETETVSFMASIDAGVIVRPGQIIEISDPVRAGSRRGGRIKSATTTAITVDDATGLSATNTPTLSVILSDGTVQARSVSTVVGNVITVSSAFSLAPNANSVWIFETSNIQTTTWRVLGIQEQDQCKYAITALSYNSSKYDYIERGVTLQTRTVSSLNAVPAAPTNISFTEALYSYQSQVRSKIIVSWKGVSGVNQYLVKYRKDYSNWTTVTRQNADYEILDTTPGYFEVNVYSLSAGGQSSATALTGTITALGKTAAPSNVTGFTSVLDGNIGATLTWTPITDLDLSEYEIRKGSSWATATFVTKVTATSYKLGQLAPGTVTYLIKAVDTSGIYSATAASTTVTITSPSTPSVTATVAGDLVTLSWAASTGSYSIASYVVRSSVAAIGEIKTTTTSLPITWSGSRTFYVKAVDLAGNQSAEGSVALTVTQAPAPTISVAYAGQNAVLTWNEVNGTTKTRFYQITRGAAVIATIQTTNFSVKVDWTGAQTFSVQAVDANSNLGAAASLTISPSAAAAPTVSSVLSGAQVVLTWGSVQGSLPTAYYDVRYGANYASGTSLGVINGNSFTLNGAWIGDRTFWIAAVDTAGNVGAAGSVIVTITSATTPTITASFAGNMLTLNWTAVSGSLPVIGYEVRKGATYATATVLGQAQSTTYKTEASWVGSQTFWVTGINSNNDLGTSGSVVATVLAPPAPSVSNSFKGDQALLTWNAVQGSLDTAYYQIRRGSTFSTATVLAEIKSTSFSLKVDWSGTQRFWVLAFDARANQGTEQSQDVVVTVPSAPTITQQTIDNNVLLTWTDATQTLPLTSYELRRGSTWAGASVIGTKQGKFTVIFETASGTYTYWLAGIDSAGNYGTPSSVVAAVNQPPDYVLQYNLDSTFSGTSTNLVPNAGGLVASVNTSETWTTHFTSRGWTSPQDQINAGYPYFLEPSQTSAQYYEDIDYGTVLAGTKITATLNSTAVSGSTTITPTISIKKLSTDAWTVYSGTSSVYGTDFRYIRVTYEFASSGGDDLLQLNALNIRLDSKLINDSGTGNAVSTDSGGTVVNFTRTFVDVSSISVTPLSTSALIAVYDFVDVPYPTSFKVLLYNTSGTRVSGAFSWSARGV